MVMFTSWGRIIWGVLSPPTPPRTHTYMVTTAIKKYVIFYCDIDEFGEISSRGVLSTPSPPRLCLWHWRVEDISSRGVTHSAKYRQHRAWMFSMCSMLFRRLYTLMPYRYDWKSVAQDRPMAFDSIQKLMIWHALGNARRIEAASG